RSRGSSWRRWASRSTTSRRIRSRTSPPGGTGRSAARRARPMRSAPPLALLVVALVVLAVLLQLVPLYTDWLWFQEVGYSQVFLTTLSLRGTLFAVVALTVALFLWANLTLAARTAAPDVLWELEDQLGLPGRVVIEPLIRRFLPGGARTHLLLLGAALLALKAVGFWLDRYEIVFSARGLVFGASYTDVHATLPMLGALAVLAVLTAVACATQIMRPGLRLLAGAGAALRVVWVVGLGMYPAFLQRLRVAPNELEAERPYFDAN